MYLGKCNKDSMKKNRKIERKEEKKRKMKKYRDRKRIHTKPSLYAYNSNLSLHKGSQLFIGLYSLPLINSNAS